MASMPNGRTHWMAAAVLLSGCVSELAAPDERSSLLRAYDTSRVACRGLDDDERANPLASIRWIEARPVRGFSGKARVQRTEGVRLFATTEVSAREIERRALCRALLVASHQADLRVDDPLSVEDVQVRAHRVGDRVELRLTAPTRSGGAQLFERGRALVEGCASAAVNRSGPPSPGSC